MKVSTDSLIAALLHPSLHLIGDVDGGVSLYCREHTAGHPIAYYGRDERDGSYRQCGVAYVTSIPTLWTEAAKHLAGAHRTAA